MQRRKRWLATGIQLAKQHQLKIRFLLTGVLNTVVGLGMYPALYFLLNPLHIHYLVILTISHVVCVTFAFLTTKFLVFRTTGNFIPEFGKFGTYHLIVYLTNMVVLPVLVNFTHMNPVWAQLSFAVIVIVSSYFWHSRISFSTHEKRVEKYL